MRHRVSQHKYHVCHANSRSIITISGFRGHAFGSFKCRCCGNMWLRDFLPNDFERARVFIYGYDTVKSSSQTIIELGRTFVEKFRALRANTKWRPWIIIGHSLGGLVAKEVQLPFYLQFITYANTMRRPLHPWLRVTSRKMSKYTSNSVLCSFLACQTKE